MKLLWMIFLGACRLFGDPIQATFVGVNGAEDFGYYVGPYYGELDGEPVVFDCVDFANEVNFGQQWMVNLTPIDTTADLANMRYGWMPNALQLYREAAWLTEQYADSPVSDYGDIQATIWQLFDPSAPSPSSDYWLREAEANYASGNYSGFFVVTNVGPVDPTGQVQEFLTVLTPEPKWMAAVGLGLIGMALVIRRCYPRRR